VVWVDAFTVVAFVSYYGRPFQGGYEVGVAVDCTVFTVCKKLSVTISS